MLVGRRTPRAFEAILRRFYNVSKRNLTRAPVRPIKARAEAVPTLKRRTVLSARRTRVEAHFKGPLPPPNILSQYDRVFPGLGDRIVTMAEREQQARIRSAEESDARKKALTEQACKESSDNSKMTRRGQTCGLIITGTCILCALYCVVTGKSDSSVWAFIAIPTASFIGSFMPRPRQRNEKDNT